MCLTRRNFADTGLSTTESDGGHSYILSRRICTNSAVNYYIGSGMLQPP